MQTLASNLTAAAVALAMAFITIGAVVTVPPAQAQMQTIPVLA